MSINWVQILIKDSAFCLIQTFKNVYLCPTQRIDCSLMHVLIGLGHKNLHSSVLRLGFYNQMTPRKEINLV